MYNYALHTICKQIDVTIEDEEYESYNSNQSVSSHGNTRICGYDKSIKQNYRLVFECLFVISL